MLKWMEGHPGVAAWLQFVGAMIALFVAIGLPLLQDKVVRRAERRSLRHALRTQVRVMAQLYIDEFHRWQDAEFLKHPRTPQLPPLTVVEADSNVGKLGLLPDNEIIAIMWLWGSWRSLSAFVSGKTEQQLREAREDIQLLLSDVCKQASAVLQPIQRFRPDDLDKTELDEMLSGSLHNCWRSMKEIRDQRKQAL